MTNKYILTLRFLSLENQELRSTAKGIATSKAVQSAKTATATSPVTEEEIRAVLLKNGPVMTWDLITPFKARLKTAEVCYFPSLIVIKICFPNMRLNFLKDIMLLFVKLANLLCFNSQPYLFVMLFQCGCWSFF